MNAFEELERLMEKNKDVLIRLKNGTFKPMDMEKQNYPDCPIFDMNCPYCLASGECIIDNPMTECDDYYYYYAEEK